MKLIAALVKVFKNDGQKLQDFHEEVKQLTPTDRQDFCNMFAKEMPELGEVIDPKA